MGAVGAVIIASAVDITWIGVDGGRGHCRR